MKTSCVVCLGELMMRVYRHDLHDNSIEWTASKDTSVSDPLHPGPDEWVGQLWCPECGILYLPE